MLVAPWKTRVSRWAKDGAWHITETYQPTEAEREAFPTSYPPGDSGPFYRWIEDTYDTEAEALAAVQSLDDAS